MSRLVSRDVRTTTASNIAMIQEITSLNIWTAKQCEVKDALALDEMVEVPALDKWRIPYLCKLLSDRSQAYFEGRDEDVKTLSMYIDSLTIN